MIKKIVCLLLTICLCSCTNGYVTQKDTSVATIVVDAGHGGMDSGMVAPDGTYEKDINLAICIKIKEQMEIINPDIKVLLTRTQDDLDTPQSDEVLNLRYRTDFAKENDADYFLSIHCDSFADNSDVCGFTGHYNNKDTVSEAIFANIENELTAVQWGPSRGLKSQEEGILQIIEEASMPALLLEVGFLTNPLDLDGLENDAYQTEIASAIAKAYNSYITKKAEE